jgi:hypothetical protein
MAMIMMTTIMIMVTILTMMMFIIMRKYYIKVQTDRQMSNIRNRMVHNL